MTLHWHSSQVFSPGNCVDNTPTETGLRACTIVQTIAVFLPQTDS